LVIDTTTSAVAQSQDLSRRAAAAGIDYLDAPVSVTGQNHAGGNRTVMVGGDRQAFVRALALLESIAPTFAMSGLAVSERRRNSQINRSM
jgi:3-hydroxyisobutyrate dehydrogenase